VIDNFALFKQKQKSIIRITDSEVPLISQYFEKMQEEEDVGGNVVEDNMQAYLQLLMVTPQLSQCVVQKKSRA